MYTGLLSHGFYWKLKCLVSRIIWHFYLILHCAKINEHHLNSKEYGYGLLQLGFKINSYRKTFRHVLSSSDKRKHYILSSNTCSTVTSVYCDHEWTWRWFLLTSAKQHSRKQSRTLTLVRYICSWLQNNTENKHPHCYCCCNTRLPPCACFWRHRRANQPRAWVTPWHHGKRSLTGGNAECARFSDLFTKIIQSNTYLFLYSVDFFLLPMLYYLISVPNRKKTFPCQTVYIFLNYNNK